MAGAGANEGEQAAAAAREEPSPPIILATAANARPPPATLLDPRLFMAARRGDSKQLKDLLLLLEDDDDEDPATAVRRPPVEAEAAQQVVVVQVDSELSSAGAAPAPAPAPSPAPAPLPVVLDGGGVTMDGDSLLHVVAACGDGEEFIKCAKMIVRDKERKGGAGAKRLVLEARNSNGDTPLHCAAGAGNAEMISCLVALANTADAKAFVRIRNRCGETSLHHAIRRAASADNNADKVVVCIIDRLMSVDSELACIPAEGEEGASASPLYLAISLGDLEIAEHLLVKSDGRLSYAGPDGRNVLHAAVSCGRALPILLKLLKDQTKTADLVWQLTSQRDKLDGRTPLHSATAALKARPWSCLLFRLFPQFLSGSWWAATKALLDANVSTAYQADNEGSYPVHAAAWSHCLSVVKLLLERCPDSATLRDGKGRTFLHVAVEEEFPGMVQYVCGMPQFACILNAQDKNGLHRAVHAGNVAICSCLIRNRQVRLDVANKDGMTPLDLAWSLNPPGFSVFHESKIYYRDDISIRRSSARSGSAAALV
ncbi:protein ACCELERATED CELL DEATH 6-like isoform X1 [Panicum virgatum]|uniref:protein ACCELERATED CELL DEATH 6-like isoform X1 n=1 Tax=Panicum virgatum TaxID=38727 RepID=UPI0019D67B24|nr:protein ACCELERATED CELL DEATH 6-like isoform X1 [Panicum virgatum]